MADAVIICPGDEVLVRAKAVRVPDGGVLLVRLQGSTEGHLHYVPVPRSEIHSVLRRADGRS